MVRKYVDLMVHARQNMFWLTAGDLFTVADGKPVLNAARLRRLVELFTRAGMHYIEGPHLAHRPDNQWQALGFIVATQPNVEASSLEGVRWVAAMAGQLQAEITARGWQDRWVQHVTDEPIDENAADYRLVAGTIRPYMPGVKLLDATICKAVAGALDIREQAAVQILLLCGLSTINHAASPIAPAGTHT